MGPTEGDINFLDPSATAGSDGASSLGASPRTLIAGRYELIERLGSGGMGLVYRALQLRPVQRHVAIKLIKLGMDTEEILRRFELERQALATLGHPNIAAVYDAGRTETDRPFFAMELVEGPNLIAYCAQNESSVAQRIELFLKVCRAVQHAHTRGLIHRDLKPGNILVSSIDGSPEPKVIDFGIARVFDSSNTQLTLTSANSTLGTPAYMSPEQLRGAHLADTRSDVYSLGVILFELMTSRLPFDLDDSGRPKRSDVELPGRPSTRLVKGVTKVADPARRREEGLARALKGELDWVILKCLEPQPDRRYAAVGELIEDLERFQRGEPTRASPPSRWRQTAWFVRRHRTAVGVGAAVMVALFAGLAGTSYGLIREKRIGAELARQKADAENQRAEADRRRVEAEESQQTVADVNTYLTGIFRQANPEFAGTWKKDLTLREALDQVAGQLARDLESQKLVRAEVCETIGQAYAALGEGAKGLPLIRLALEIREKSLGPDDPKTVLARYNLAYVLSDAGYPGESLPIMQQVLEDDRRTKGNEHRDTIATMHSIGNDLGKVGRLEESERVLKETLSLKRRLYAPTDRSLYKTMNVLVATLMKQQKYDEAYPLAMEVMQFREQTLGRDHPETLFTMASLSGLLRYLGRPAEAEAMADDGMERTLRLLGEKHAVFPGFVRNKVVLLRERGRADEAAALMERYGLDDAKLNIAGPTSAPASQPATSAVRIGAGAE